MNQLINLLLIALSSIFSFLFVEVVLRCAGDKPLGTQKHSAPYFQQHKTRGWSHRPGTYVMAAKDFDGTHAWKVTLNKKGIRSSSPSIDNTKPLLLAIGGSYTFGWGVKDSATYSAFLQQKYPELQVVNLGVSGYGSYQALLTLKEFVDTLPSSASIAHVFYGALFQHRNRDALLAKWIIPHFFTNNHLGPMPWVSVDSGTLTHHMFAGSLNLPGRDYFALIKYIELAHITLHRRIYAPPPKPTFVGVLKKMKAYAEDKGGQFHIVLVDNYRKDALPLASLLHENGLSFIDATDQVETTEENYLPNRHPKEPVHAIIAERIANRIDED